MSRSTGMPRSQRVNWWTISPAAMLGGVDCAAGRAAARLGLGLGKERRGVMVPADVLGHRQHTDHFAQHPAVAQKRHRGPADRQMADRASMESTQQKTAWPISCLGPVAVLDALHGNSRIEP